MRYGSLFNFDLRQNDSQKDAGHMKSMIEMSVTIHLTPKASDRPSIFRYSEIQTDITGIGIQKPELTYNFEINSSPSERDCPFLWLSCYDIQTDRSFILLRMRTDPAVLLLPKYVSFRSFRAGRMAYSNATTRAREGGKERPRNSA